MKTTEEILDYIFKNLSADEDKEFDNAIDNDPILADVVDGMIKFCKDFDITSKEEFYEKWEGI